MKIHIQENTYIYLVVLLLLVPFPWLCAWLIAVFFHEFCHWLSVRLCGGRVYSLTIGVGGANMACETLSPLRELISVLSGPMGGILLAAINAQFPRIALCSWVLSVYNLLPILPLDGGHALQILLNRRRAFFLFEKFVLIILTLCAVYFAFCLHLGILPLALIGGLWLKNRKTPCKESVCKVQ